MEKNTFKKVLVLVFAVLMCAMSVICVSASPESYATGRKYTYSGTEYTADRPASATVITHVYYVGGDNGSDSNDGSTKEKPFASISGAVAYAKKQGYLLDVDYTTNELHEVKLVLVGDTVETPTSQETVSTYGDKASVFIQGGILTIVPDDGVNATVTIGTSSNKVNENFFYVAPSGKNAGKYAEFNLGAPGMNGTITFDGTYYYTDTSNLNPSWKAFLRIGDESYTDVAIANMYDGITIANMGYDEVNKSTVTTSHGHVILADCGTFNMYGGTITQNVCYSVIASYGRSGLGAYIYGGEFTKNIARVLYTYNSADAKIVVYDCLIQNNSSDAWGAIETSVANSTIILYGGKLLDNIGAGKNKSDIAVNAQVFSNGYIYVSDKVEITNETFTGLDGNTYTAEKTYYVENHNYDPLKMKSTVIYAKDGSAIGYGYVSGKQGYYLKDRNIETTETLTLEKVEGYDLYKKPGTTSCAYAISDNDAIYTGITPSADMKSAVYYYNSAKTHNESYEILTPATETTNGTGRYTCQDCEATRDVTIPAKNHEHNYTQTVTDPTCTEQGYTTHTCAGCGDSYVDTYVDALGHDYSGEGTVVTPPTCLEKGYSTYTCQREGCGYSYVGDYVSILGHDYVETVKEVPTASSTGINLYTCSRCHDFSQERVTYLAPTDVDVKVTVNVDGVRNKLTVKMSDIYNYDYTAPSATADYALALTGIKTFTVGDTKYTKDKVVEISVPFGVLTVNSNGSLFNGNRVIEKVDFSTSDGVTINGNAFENSTIKDIVFGNNMTINGSAFKNCDALTKIVVGNGLTINFKGEWVFNGCKNISSAEFGASNITFGNNSFRTTGSTTDYTPLNSVKFSDGGTYTFGGKAFARTKITKLILPDGATVKFLSTNYSNTDAFWQCNFLTYVYLGEGTKSAGKLFDNCSGLQKVVLVGPTYIHEYGFCVGSDNSNVTGEDVVLKVYIHKSNCTFGGKTFLNRSGVQVYTMSPITNPDIFNSCVATTKIVDGVSVSYPAYTIYYGIPHEYTAHKFDPTCTTEGYDGFITDCPHCQANAEPDYGNVTYSVYEATTTNKTATSEVTLAKKNIVSATGHTAGNVIRIVYENGFDKAGVHVRTCSVCASNYNAEEASAIFAALGYSIKDTSAGSTSNAIYGGFTVNTTALAEYNSYTTTPLKYGIIVSNVTGDDVTNISFTDNIINGKSIQVQINDTSFTRFGFTLTGFDSDTAKALNIVISAYVIDENGEMSFVQQEAKTSLPDGVTSYYVKTVTVNNTEKTLGAMSFNQITTLTTAGVVTEDKATTEAKEDEPSDSGTT